MSTLTQAEQQKIADWLATHDLPSGLGTEESACSIASINLALTGRLTDSIPDCMSPVIGRWIIGVQDAMPTEIRNSPEWKRLLPLAAGTGRQHEAKRIELLLDWVWTQVLPQLLPVARQHGFAIEWQTMLDAKSGTAARAAADAAAADTDADAATAYAAAAAYAYAYAAAYADADAAAAAARAAAADAAVRVGGAAYADAADAAARAAARAAYAAATDSFWANVNPCAMLAKLIDVQEGAMTRFRVITDGKTQEAAEYRWHGFQPGDIVELRFDFGNGGHNADGTKWYECVEGSRPGLCQCLRDTDVEVIV